MWKALKFPKMSKQLNLESSGTIKNQKIVSRDNNSQIIWD